MKKALMTFIAALFIFFAGFTVVNVNAAESNSSITGIYIEPKIGVDATLGQYLDRKGLSRDSGFASDAALAGGLSTGYDFWYQYEIPVRVEAEYVVRTTSHFRNHGRDVRAIAPQTVFGNVYWDFHNDTDFTPYIGGGIGAAFVGPKNNFAWNAGAGIAYGVTENLKATLGYRFVSFGEIEDRHTTGILNSHEVLAGLRYTF